MCSFEPLREFIRQRLRAAAEEIFSEVENTVRLLELGWRNQINQEPTDLRQQEVLDDQQLWSQDRNHGSDQRESEPWAGRDGERLPLKQEETLSAPHILEIFGASEIGPVRFEEDTDLRRRLLDPNWKPERKSHRTEPEQQPVSEEKVLTDQQTWSWSLDQDQPEPPQVKQNQEEPELPLKQEYQEEPEPPRVKQNQERIPQNSETCTAPTDKESDQTEPEPNPEEVRDQDGFCKAEESEPDQRSKVKTKRAYAESSSGSESVDEGGEGFPVRRKGPSAEPEPEPSTSRELSSFRETPAASRTHRTQAAESLYSCDACGKRFRFRCRYQSHVRTHTGEKPFSCRQCGKSFTQGGSLWRHVRTHSGEKPFLCITCGRSFSQKTGLLGHIRTQHSADKPSSG